MNRTLCISIVCLFALGLAACDSSGSDDPVADTTTDTATGQDTVLPDVEPQDNATPDTSVPDTTTEDQAIPDTAEPDAAGQCNNLVPTAAVIGQVEIGEDAPVLAGGTIVDGTYVLTKWEKYVGAGETPEPSQQNRRDIIVFSNGTVEFVVDFPGVVFKTYSFTYTVSANELMITQTCPDQNQASPDFEATETTFKWLNGKELTYFTKM